MPQLKTLSSPRVVADLVGRHSRIMTLLLILIAFPKQQSFFAKAKHIMEEPISKIHFLFCNYLSIKQVVIHPPFMHIDEREWTHKM